MPLEIEILSTLSTDDVVDLHKIYADYPKGAVQLRLTQWQHTLTSNWLLCAARFNGRLLGALWLEQSEPLLIHDICVRQITRQRGVGEYLLRAIQQRYPNARLATGITANTHPALAHIANKLALECNTKQQTH